MTFRIESVIMVLRNEVLKHMELVILAAGMGSRFGGLKQIEPIDEYGNFIIDYSIYDAIKKTPWR